MDKETNYFKDLNKVKCEIEKKNGLSYVSWADAWEKVKEIYPESEYVIYENEQWFPFWQSSFWIDCKVWVIINNIEHIIRLPVMDWANKAMKDISYTYKTKYGEKTCEAATQFDINKTIMRAFAKAIAMHWIGLYVYRGEDIPKEEWEYKPTAASKTKNVDEQKKWLNFEELTSIAIEIVEPWEVPNKEQQATINWVIQEDWFTVSWNGKNALLHFYRTGEIVKDLFFNKR